MVSKFTKNAVGLCSAFWYLPCREIRLRWMGALAPKKIRFTKNKKNTFSVNRISIDLFENNSLPPR
jgi:hypothetical protein